MAVRVLRPDDWQGSDFVEVGSDVADLRRAIEEVEEWAYDRGFRRTAEEWLRRMTTDAGERLHLSVLYRVSAAELRDQERRSQAWMDRTLAQEAS